MTDARTLLEQAMAEDFANADMAARHRLWVDVIADTPSGQALLAAAAESATLRERIAALERFIDGTEFEHPNTGVDADAWLARAALAAADQRGMERCPHCRGTGVNVSDCICSHTPPDQPTPPATGTVEHEVWCHREHVGGCVDGPPATAPIPEPSPSAALVRLHEGADAPWPHPEWVTACWVCAEVDTLLAAARAEGLRFDAGGDAHAESYRRGWEAGHGAARAEGLDGLVEALREAQFAAHQLARHSGHARDCRQHQCAGWLALAARARRSGGEAGGGEG